MNKKKFVISLLIVLILSLISSLTLVLTPMYIGQSVDAMIVNETNFSYINKILLLVIILYAIHFLASFVLNLFSSYLAISLGARKREDLNKKLLKLPFSYLDTFDSSHVQNLLGNDANLLTDGLNLFLSQALVGALILIIAVYLMFKVNVLMTLGILVLSPLIYFVSKRISVSSIEAYRLQQRKLDDLSSFTRNNLESHILIDNYNYHAQSVTEFKDYNDALNKTGLKAQILSSLINPSTRLINNILYVFVAMAGAYSYLYLNLTVGSFLSFISYTLMFTKPINEMSTILTEMISAKTAYERIEKFLALEDEKDSKKDLLIEDPQIKFSNLDFAYRSDQKLIENLNLHLSSKSKIAIVGPTGAGKSTIINLLMRYYDPLKGAIYFDEYNIADYSKKSVRDKIGIVLQEPWVFEGTIAENIAYGNPDVGMEEIILAAKDAECHELIMRFPDAYETNAKNQLSLGEKQMITVARALLIEKDIYILDEATSNLDSLSEYKIQKTFQRIMSNHTSFVVAHRLHTIVDADLIIVMKDGSIIEQGTHEDLMKKESFYKLLYESQF